MSTPAPPSPPATRVRRPSWLDLRLVVGVLLVLVSVVLGARIVASADRSVQVWALARDVSAGTLLSDADLRPARVRLFDSAAAYLQVNRSPTGRVVSRPLRAGELLPAAALEVRPPAVIVSIPVRSENAPAVARGQLVDVWSTAKGCIPVRVLAGVAVQEVRASGGGALSVSAGSLQVIVRVAQDQAERVVAALGTEATIRLLVLDGTGASHRTSSAPVDSCRTSGQPGGFRPSRLAAGRVAGKEPNALAGAGQQSRPQRARVGGSRAGGVGLRGVAGSGRVAGSASGRSAGAGQTGER